MTQSNTSKNNESLKNKINKNNIPVNRGVELILSGGKKKRKPFHILFNKIVCFFNTEIDIYFEFSLLVKRKNNSKGGNKWP